jgi:nucleoid-associated protein YgaU
MAGNPGRMFGGLAGLAVLWILVYWFWTPKGGQITFDAGDRPREPGAQAELLPPALPSGNSDPAPTESPDALPAGAGPRTVQPAAVIPPRFRDYTVTAADRSVAEIARRELGSAALADAILEANPLMDPTRLRPGRVIRLPLDPSNIRGKAAPAEPQAVAGQVPAGPAPAEPAPGPAAAEYIVKADDTLSGISKSQYGSIRFVDLIRQANGLEDDHLKIGQKLRLPPKPQ